MQLDGGQAQLLGDLGVFDLHGGVERHAADELGEVGRARDGAAAAKRLELDVRDGVGAGVDADLQLHDVAARGAATTKKICPPPHPARPASAPLTPQALMDHYSNPRNVGSMDKKDLDVGTGLVVAAAAGGGAGAARRARGGGAGTARRARGRRRRGARDTLLLLLGGGGGRGVGFVGGALALGEDVGRDLRADEIAAHGCGFAGGGVLVVVADGARG